jgi:hypothetical protein
MLSANVCMAHTLWQLAFGLSRGHQPCFQSILLHKQEIARPAPVVDDVVVFQHAIRELRFI